MWALISSSNMTGGMYAPCGVAILHEYYMYYSSFHLPGKVVQHHWRIDIRLKSVALHLITQSNSMPLKEFKKTLEFVKIYNEIPSLFVQAFLKWEKWILYCHALDNCFSFASDSMPAWYMKSITRVCTVKSVRILLLLPSSKYKTMLNKIWPQSLMLIQH